MTATITRSPSRGLTTWQIDPAHTQVEFEVRHMMFAKVRGRFTDFAGSLVLGPEGKEAQSRVAVTIRAASVDTGQAQRDEHLRAPEFFDVERFPELTFESSAVRPVGDRLSIKGLLTIRGVTREVVLEATESGEGIDPWGKQRIGFSASTAIDRRDFGLTWNQALETGGVLVGNEVRISLEVEAVREDS